MVGKGDGRGHRHKGAVVPASKEKWALQVNKMAILVLILLIMTYENVMF